MLDCVAWEVIHGELPPRLDPAGRFPSVYVRIFADFIYRWAFLAAARIHFPMNPQP